MISLVFWVPMVQRQAMFRELERIRRSFPADGLESLNVRRQDKQQHRIRASRLTEEREKQRQRETEGQRCRKTETERER